MESVETGQSEEYQIPSRQNQTSHLFVHPVEIGTVCSDALLYQPYSPDLASLDYSLFRSLQNYVNRKPWKYVRNPYTISSHSKMPISVRME